jgi:two-component system CheB/CheR fusion protein
MAAKKRTPRRRAPGQPTKALPGADVAPGAPSEPGPVLSARLTFPVVGIGASAGGLDALRRFLDAMPAGSGIAFVFIPHLDPARASLLHSLLARHTPMPVVVAAEGMSVEPNRVYVIPPNKYLAIRAGVLQLSGPVAPRDAATTIDRFFRSLADDMQERAVGIVLSGTGSYGTLGLRAIKANGGMVMVQDPVTAEYADMPRNALATGVADHVLAPEQMPEALVRYARHPHLQGGLPAEAGPIADESVGRILGVVLAHTKHNFGGYRKEMLRRRIERRMGLRTIASFPDYLAYVHGHPEEAGELAHDLLIGVTSFFRDPEAFHVLETQAIAPLVEAKDDNAPVRVWVPSCATGEEAYSVAMVLLERLAAARKACRLQVFATDLNAAALAFARQGLYPEGIAADVSPERLSRFFVRAGDGRYQLVRQVREVVTFAPHDLVTDVPFSRLDLVSCRNVLIYLEPEVQRRVVAHFHFALNVGGYLFLGASETVGPQVDLFQPLSKRWRLFRRIGSVRAGLVGAASARAEATSPTGPVAGLPVHASYLTEHLLLQEYAPAAVLIDPELEVLYFHGRTGRYLDQPTGAPTRNLLTLAREGLRSNLRTAITGAIQARQAVTVTGLRLKREEATQTVKVTVHPVRTPGVDLGYVLVVFEDEPQPVSSPVAAGVAAEAGVRQLVADLIAAREDLQMTAGELETSNEELRAANEELSSTNEEFQSTNEELEVAKEELQSLNEQLQVANSQLQEKVGELERAEGALRQLNDELEQRVAQRMAELQIANEGLRAEIAERQRLAAIVESSEDAIIGKTLEGTILSWNAAAERIYGYPAAEVVGRSINLIYPPEQADELRSILERIRRDEHVAHFKTRRVSKDGRKIVVSVSISPVKDAAGVVVGASAIARDITEQERMEEMLRMQGQVAAHMAEGINIVRQRDAVLVYANERFEELFGYEPGELFGKHVSSLNAPGDRSPEEVAEEILSALREHGAWKGEVQNLRKDGTPFWTQVSITTFDHPEHGAVWISVQSDLTERKQMEDRLREGRERLQAIVANAGDAIITIDRRGLIEAVNPAAETLFGYTAEELIGQNVGLLMPAPHRQVHDSYLTNYQRTGIKHIIGTTREVPALHKDGFTFPAELTVSEVGQLGLFTGILRDITRRKELEREVLEIAALEQRRIGQELHDSVGQELTGLGLLADALAQRLAKSFTEAQMATRVVAGLERVHQQVRFLSRGLVPVDVDPEGLRAALEELANRTSDLSGITCMFESVGPVQVTDAATASHLYRIAQEAVTNSLRHGQARHLEISLRAEGEALTLGVRDDGIGVPGRIEQRKGLGIRLMRNRASLIGATLTIGPAEVGGTLVRCILSRGNVHA